MTTKLKPRDYDTDSGIALVYDTLCDRDHDPDVIAELLDNYDGDLWMDVFGPAIDRAAELIGTTAYPGMAKAKTALREDLRVCIGCGRKFTLAALQKHHDECPRYRLECALAKAQDKIKA